MTENQAKVAFVLEMKSVSSLFSVDEIDRLVDKTTSELGWSFPLSTRFKKYWFIERMKRHGYWMLLTEAAHKFKYKQVNLQHRFEHYKFIVAEVDKNFQAAIAENPAEMAGVDPVQMFGHTIAAGFSYDEFGSDTTYEKSNKVSIAPDEYDT